MTDPYRVLPPEPLESLDAYERAGGGAGIKAALAAGPEAVIAEMEASGLRGRGGAGFPTGVKWRTVWENASSAEASTVVVNAAEGEPGTFKDRAILRRNPYSVIEGALIAATTIRAAEAVIAMKRSFTTEVGRIRQAIDEIAAAGWAPGIELLVLEGPEEYLYGEETALLEVVDGRMPFPRVAPPFRRGAREVVEHADDVDSESAQPAHVVMAGPRGTTVAPPTLLNNVETMANVPGIVVYGADWFRSLGTERSPGTIVCTITGSTQRHGVGEVPMGTPLRAVIDTIGGGVRAGRRIRAVMPGVANSLLAEADLDAPVSYEGLEAVGGGLGSAGFIVYDDLDDLAAVAAGVSRFLAVESCGQCTPCKQDGLALSDRLARLARSEAKEEDVEEIESLLGTVADEARCYLATQHQVVVSSILQRFGDDVAAHLKGQAPASEPAPVSELLDIEGDVAVIDEHRLAKQPDWSYEPVYSGQWPAQRYDDPRGRMPT